MDTLPVDMGQRELFLLDRKLVRLYSENVKVVDRKMLARKWETYMWGCNDNLFR